MRRKWGQEKVEGKQKKRKASTTVKKPHTTFHERVRQLEEEFTVKIREEKSELQKLIISLKIDETKLTNARRDIMRRRLLKERLDTANRRLDEITSGKALKVFQKKVKRYAAVQATIREKPKVEHKKKKSVKTSIKKSSPKRGERARRKIATHSRTIKVSSEHSGDGFDVLMQELEEELDGGHDVDSAPIYISSVNVCPTCPNTLMQKIPSESIMVCPKCGVLSRYLDSSAQSTGIQDERSFSAFSYSRDGHFDSWLRNLQGKESTTIPDEVIQKVCEELYKKRIPVEDVTPKRVRECLKVLKYSKYYENSVLICSTLTGKQPPRFSCEMEKNLQLMFRKIQGPFETAVLAVDPTRKNFLSYAFCAYKLVQLIEDNKESVWTKRLPRLKGRDKVYRSDRIWAHICAQLNWKFYPSV